MTDDPRWYLTPPESAGPGATVTAWPRSGRTGRDPLAVAAAVTGLVPPSAPVGIVLGAVARHRIRRSGGRGLRLATVGLVGGVVWTVLVAGVAGYLVWRTTDLAATRDAGGAVTGAGRLPSDDLRVGDCLAATPAGGTARWVEVTPCTSTHTGEVFDVAALPDGPAPSDAQLAEAATALCASSYRNGLGAEHRDAVASAGGRLHVLRPTPGGWRGGDRDVVCVAATPPRDAPLGLS